MDSRKESGAAAEGCWQKLWSRKIPFVYFLLITAVLLILLIAILVLVVTRPQPGCTACPGGWLGHNESCYYFSSGEEYRTWNESRETCERMGADLLIIKDQIKKDFIDRFSKGQAGEVFWIGMYRDGAELRGVNGQRYDTGLFQLSGESSGNFIRLQAGERYSNSDGKNKHSWICEKRALKI